MVSKSMREIMAELKVYNDTHKHALTYGQYILKLEQEEKQKAEQGKRKRRKKKSAEQALKS